MTNACHAGTIGGCTCFRNGLVKGYYDVRGDEGLRDAGATMFATVRRCGCEWAGYLIGVGHAEMGGARHAAKPCAHCVEASTAA